jgi:recombination protein RecA
MYLEDLMDIDDKEKVIENTLSQIERQYGKGAIMKLGHYDFSQGIACIPTGSIELDMALGIGGIPRGRVTEIFGPEASGKTTLALHIISNAQKEGGTVAFIDAEHALDPIYARSLGVNTEELLLSQPDNGEQALEICEILLKSGALEAIVIDSVAALVPRAELEGEMEDSQVGLQARLMSKALRKITGVVNRTRTAVIFINQLREKIGVMFGNPEVTPGGRALKYYASVRLDIRRIDNIKDGTEIVGNRTRVRVVKNKVAPPFKSAEFDIMYGKGISKEGSIVDVGAELEILVKSGSWYSYKDERIGQGRENTKVFLMQNPDILNKIENEIKEKLNFKSSTRLGSEKHELKPGTDKESIQKEIAGKKDSNKKVTGKKVNITEPKGDFNLE